MHEPHEISVCVLITRVARRHSVETVCRILKVEAVLTARSPVSFRDFGLDDESSWVVSWVVSGVDDIEVVSVFLDGDVDTRAANVFVMGFEVEGCHDGRGGFAGTDTSELIFLPFESSI